MKTTIQIKTWAGEVYFEHEMDGNSIKETVKAKQRNGFSEFRKVTHRRIMR